MRGWLNWGAEEVGFDSFGNHLNTPTSLDTNIGCREHRQEIIDHLEKQADAATLATKLKAGAIALAAGLPLTIPGLVDEAIRRAEVTAGT